MAFSADDAPSFEFMSDAFTTNVVARSFRRLREFLITKFDLETADSVMPDYEIESLSAAAIEQQLTPEKDDPMFNHSNGDTAVPKEYTEAEIAQLQKDAADNAVSTFSQENKDLKNKLQATEA